MDLNQDLVHRRRTHALEMIGERNKAFSDKLQEIAIYHGKFDLTQSLVEHGVKFGIDEKQVPTALHGQDQMSEYREGMKYTRCLCGIKTAHEGLVLCYTCYCENIQLTAKKDYTKLLQVGSGLTALRPG